MGTIPIDDTSYSIIRQVSLKSAAALAGSITYANANDVLAVATTFEEWLLAPFAKPTGQPSNVPPQLSGSSFPAPQNLPDPFSPPGTPPPSQPSSQPCPNCLEAGRNGVVLTKTSKAGKTYQACSLRKSAKRNGEWVDVGLCSWFQSD